MNIIQRTKIAFKMAVAGWKSTRSDFTRWMGRRFWGIDNSSLATNETIFAVITRLANIMSTLPLKLYKNYDVVTNDIADLVTMSPNPNMSAFDFINALEVSRNETGNGYAFILRDVQYMQPIELIPLDASAVDPFINEDDGLIWYRVRAANGTYVVPNTEMIHVKHIVGTNRLVGINPLKVLANTIRYDKAVQEFSLSEMEKKDSFILTYGTNVDKDTRDKVVADFRAYYANNGGVLFQEPGVEIKDIAKTYFSSDTIASERITRSRIANVFNMPLSFLNESNGGTASSNEQEMKRFVDMTLLAILRQYESEFNRKLLTKEDRKRGLYFKFNVGGLLRGDTAARTAFYQMMLRTSGMKPDEVRRLEDLPPVGGNADKLYISGDLYPLDMDIELRKSTNKPSEGGEK